MISKKKLYTATWMDYVLMLLIVALTGFEFCYNYAPGIFFLVGPLALLMCIIRRRELNIKIYVFFAILLIWCIFQIITGQSTQSAMINFYIRFIIYLMAALSINEFEKVFVRIIYVFALISIPCWIISNYIPGGYNFLTSTFPNFTYNGLGLNDVDSSNPGVSIGFYYVSMGSRNNGPFWEAGMFALFLNIAYLFHILKSHNPLDKTSLVFLFCIFSTFSTTGYIAGFLILGWYYTIIEFKPQSLILLPLIALGVFYFLNSDFGISKINEIAERKQEDSRFAAIMYHLSLLQDCWISGRGFASESREMLLSPNGISFVFLFWGLPFAIYYYYLLFSSSVKIAFELSNSHNEKYIFIIFSVLIIVIFSQDVSTRHFYYFLLMYPLVPYHKFKPTK